ncbi:hypothetical protein [Candidatus Xianfuyuplasma coldseepsis]|uniref:Uncharacterized protein n=1 Tax=Candidatus Xianfuyuplasma coldseepsis TaxID=2782163 RepID=A0A7L7KSI0_9MOLU|nr:hypothetical protein [Xianfuyuplasma coldseepsis]QMS85369.1 hypothetical protein G4Z02_06255 [Xianfuyuplasma coldseepsis]
MNLYLKTVLTYSGVLLTFIIQVTLFSMYHNIFLFFLPFIVFGLILDAIKRRSGEPKSRGFITLQRSEITLLYVIVNLALAVGVVVVTFIFAIVFL